MKNLKRLMSVVLSVVMLLSFVVTTSAATFTDVAESDKAYEAVEVLAALGILEGKEAGVFDPDANIKRSEFAAVICRAMNQVPTGFANFTDVPVDHWAYDYIGWAAGEKIVNGRGDGTFDPDANVTYNEAIAMIVRALGYEYYVENYLGGYPTGYARVAGSYKIDADVNTANGNAAATRADVASLVYNAFDAPLMDYTYTIGSEPEYIVYNGSSVNGITREKRTLLSYYHDIYKFRATVDNTFKSDDNHVDAKDNKLATLTIKSSFGFVEKHLYEVFGAPFSSSNSLTDAAGVTLNKVIANNDAWGEYAGYLVNAYITVNENDKPEIVAMVPAIAGDELVIENAREAVVKADATSSYVDFNYEDADGKKRSADILFSSTVANSAKVYVNNMYVGTVNDTGAGETAFEALATEVFPTVVLNDTDNDGIFDALYMTKYVYGIVEEVDAEYEIITTNVTSYAIGADDTKEGFVYNIYKNGEKIDLADLAEGDMLNMIIGDDYTAPDVAEATFLDIYVTNDTVESTIDSIAADGKIYIDDEGYYLADGSKVKSLNPGDTGLFTFTIDGYIYEADLTSTYSDNYALILDAGSEPGVFGGNTWQIKLLKKDNSIVTLPVKSTLSVTYLDTNAVTVSGETYSDGQIVKALLKADGADITAVDLNGATPGLGLTNEYTDLDNFMSNQVVANIQYDGTASGQHTAAATDLASKVANRVVTFKEVNGEITELVYPVVGDYKEIYGASERTFIESDALTGTSSDQFNEKTVRLAGQRVLESTVLFNLPVVDDVNYITYSSTGDIYKVNEDKVQVITVSALKDAIGYNGFLYNVDRNGIGATVVTDKLGFAGNTEALAVVIGKSTGLDANNNSVTKITFMQAGETQTLIVNDDGDGATTLKAVTPGDVFQYNLNAAGEISASQLIYDYSNTQLQVTTGGAGSDIAYKMGIVTDIDSSDVKIGGSYVPWALEDGCTNVVFNTARAGKANAFAAKNGTAYIRKPAATVTLDQLTAGTPAETYNSDVYFIVVKTVDTEIVDVVAYLYDKDTFIETQGDTKYAVDANVKATFDAQFTVAP